MSTSYYYEKKSILIPIKLAELWSMFYGTGEGPGFNTIGEIGTNTLQTLTAKHSRGDHRLSHTISSHTTANHKVESTLSMAVKWFID